ncbi:MAG: ChrR family anti-sigma-E factor [Pseudomonadales bacterium]|jgi:putative transcriptional regulator|nr:ChrR family anti-sigma-E factor [Pseudomonadales bacterium]
MINNHPNTQLLTDYATGGLSMAPLISITTHLQFCDQCREAVSGLNILGGELLTECDEAELSDDLLAQTLAMLDAPMATNTDAEAAAETPKSSLCPDLASQLPKYLHRFLNSQELEWRSLSSTLSVAAISVGETDYELALHRIDAGGKAPVHDHKGTELTVVLKGSFSDEDGIYREGDFLMREPGDVHRPSATQDQACICLSVLSAPIKLTGIKQVLNPFMQFNPS